MLVFREMRVLSFAVPGRLVLTLCARSEPTPEKSFFSFQEVMIPMRDGVHLQTVILTPLDRQEPLPILLQRTPYGFPAQAPAPTPPHWKELTQDGYVFVFQN